MSLDSTALWVSKAAYNWWSSTYMVSFLTKEMASLNLFGDCQWTIASETIYKKIEGMLWIKLLFSSIGHEQSLMIKVKVLSIGPICHHRHLIQETFKRFLMTLQTIILIMNQQSHKSCQLCCWRSNLKVRTFTVRQDESVRNF